MPISLKDNVRLSIPFRFYCILYECPIPFSRNHILYADLIESQYPFFWFICTFDLDNWSLLIPKWF
jgi:hypothetical protein